MSHCDVLLAGTMGDIGPAVRSSLEAHGLKVVSFEFPQNIFRDEFGYGRGLLKAVAACDPAMIIPIGCQMALSRLKSRYEPQVIVPVEDEEKIAILDCKVSCSRLAASLGIPQPHIYSSPDETGEKQVVFKRNVSFGGHGVHLPWTRASLDQLIAHQPKGEPWLIEDFIEGEDYSVDCLRWGSSFCSSSYKSLKTKGNGPSLERCHVDFPEIENYARKILDHLDYKGVCGFDFRVDHEGKPYFLETNPRFTGGVASQVEWGFDLPYLYWKHAVQKI